MKFIYRIPIFGFFWRRYRMCWRKVQHSSEREAALVASKYGNRVHAYRCPYCRKWHVGHIGKRN